MILTELESVKLQNVKLNEYVIKLQAELDEQIIISNSKNTTTSP